MTAQTSSPADRLVDDAGAEPGDRVRVEREGEAFEGVLMPRHGFSGEDTVVLKLDSGYNVGLKLDEDDTVERLDPSKPRAEPEAIPPAESEELPDVALLGTGGTIASFVEYRTGAVYPATSPEELASAVPEAFEHANLVPEVVFEAFSEDLTPQHWMELADAIERQFDEGARGVVVTHGTDTMHFTAAALACLFDRLPGPVVLVGAQRSSDRPSSDAATNLTAAVRVAAEAEMGEVVIVMHEGMGDTAWSIHPAGRARKMHTSRRDAFRSLNAPPLGRITSDGIEWDTEPVPEADAPARRGRLADDVGLVHSYPGLSEAELEAAAGSGLVVAGTGLGHLNRDLIGTLAEIVEEGTVVAVASQCLSGRTNLKVYETGRELLEAGCIEAEDMLPETAYVKLSWAIGTAQMGDEERLAALQERFEGEEARVHALDQALEEGTEQAIATALFQLPLGRELSPRSPYYYLGGGER